MTVEFLDELPAAERGRKSMLPEVKEYLEALEANPGKWAAFPLERKSKPSLPKSYKVAKRQGVWFASYVG